MSIKKCAVVLGTLYLTFRKYEKAINAGEQSIELEPNGARARAIFARTLRFAGKPDEAIYQINYAIRLNPFSPYWYFLTLADCNFMKGRYEEALTELKKSLELSPNNYYSQIALVATYSMLGQEEQARATVKKFLEMEPSFTTRRLSKLLPYKNEVDLGRFLDAVRKAGLPE